MKVQTRSTFDSIVPARRVPVIDVPCELESKRSVEQLKMRQAQPDLRLQLENRQLVDQLAERPFGEQHQDRQAQPDLYTFA